MSFKDPRYVIAVPSEILAARGAQMDPRIIVAKPIETLAARRKELDH
jgi:hypothetical protein